MSKKTFTIEGEDYIEKVAKKANETSCRVFLPYEWEGKKVAIILLEK